MATAWRSATPSRQASLLARGQLVAPFELSVPAVDDFYVVCRNEMRSAPIVQVFIDWLFAEKGEADDRADSTGGGAASACAASGRSRSPASKPSPEPDDDLSRCGCTPFFLSGQARKRAALWKNRCYEADAADAVPSSEGNLD